MRRMHHLTLMTAVGSASLLVVAGCTVEDAASDSGQSLSCPDLHLTPCADVGLPEEENAALCDDCGSGWMCSYSESELATGWVIVEGGIPCECIIDGYVRTEDQDGVDVPGICNQPD